MESYTAQKMKFSIKDFFSKCDQIRRKLRIWSHLLKKSLMENFIFCEVLPLESFDKTKEILTLRTSKTPLRGLLDANLKILSSYLHILWLN